MKKLTVILVTALAAGSLGFLIKVPDIQQPTLRTNSMGWMHMQKLLLPLFDNVCEESTDPTIVRLAEEFDTIPISSYTNPDMLTNLKKLYSTNSQLKKGAIFTEMNPDHMYELQLVYDVLYSAQTFDTFYKTAAWARQNANCGLFVNAIYLAILKRRDTQHISVPAPYELLPHYFIRQDIIIKASLLLTGDMADTENIVNEGNAYVLDANYTSDIVSDGESKLAYIHEDIGLNTYYFLKKLQFSSWFNTEDVDSNSLEFLYHFMKQLSVRYNLERYSNGLMPLDRFDWVTCNIDSYDPMLVFSNGEEFTPRQSNIDISSLQNSLQDIEDNIMKTVPTLVQNGYSKAQIINNLMKLLVTNLENYESDARKLFASAPEKSWQSVLDHYMTSLRDPIFWKINKKIVNMVDDALKTLPGYARNELYFPGVQVMNVEVKKLMTMFEPFKFEVTDALKSSMDPPMFDVNVVAPRLNHKPFTLKLNISSMVSQKGLVKIYLGPKMLPGEFALKKDQFMLLDNFECNLKIGSNVISRTSNAIEGTSQDFVSLRILRKAVEDAEFGLDVQPMASLKNLSGFPSRLIIPKGTPEGLPMQLLVFVAPFTKVTAGGINMIPKTEFNSATLSPGYPFDLNFDDKQFIALPNVLVKDIIISHKDSSRVKKGEYDGSKKWGGKDSSDSYGPKKEPYDYNLKKSQYGKPQTNAGENADRFLPKENDDFVTDRIPEADGAPDSYFLDKEPYALKLTKGQYENYDDEAKTTKYFNKNQNKLDENKNINRNVNKKSDMTADMKDELLKNIDDMESVIYVEPKRVWSNNIEEMYKKVIPKNELTSIYESVTPEIMNGDYIYE